MHRLKHLLEGPTVHCKDVDHILNRVQKMITAGHEKLQVMCDFDQTLTCYYVNGKPGCTSHGVIEDALLMPESFRQKTKSISDKFRLIEISHELTIQEKTTAMEEWWGSIHQLIIDYKVKKQLIPSMVQTANIAFRSENKKLLSLLDDYDIPVTVFSAGLADVIHVVFQLLLSYVPKNVEIVANKMIFNKDGVVIGFQEPLIHSANKGVTAVQTCDHLKNKLTSRTNVVLLGDSQGDPAMIKGLHDVDTVIKLGFLNHKEKDLLPIYENLYDVVILGAESSLELPYVLLETILTSD